MNKLLTFIVNITRPFLKPILAAASPWSHKKITGADYYKIKEIIKPGDVILSKTYGNFSNVLNPSELKHGSLFIGGVPIESITEAVGAGVILSDLVSHLLTKDELVIVRLRLFKESTHYAEDVCSFAKSQVGKGYDYEFKSNNNNYYCFELVADSILKLEQGIELKKSKKLGSEYYTSDTFIDDNLFDVIYDSRRK